MRLNQEVKDFLSSLSVVSIKRDESKEEFMGEIEKIYDEAKWLMNGID